MRAAHVLQSLIQVGSGEVVAKAALELEKRLELVGGN